MRIRAATGMLAVSLLLGLAGADPASATFGVAGFDGAISANPAGEPFTQAGGHPYEITTTFELNAITDSQGNVMPDGGGAKDLEVLLPTGLVGDPDATSRCSTADFLAPPSTFLCPPGAQVGVAGLKVGVGRETGAGGALPLFNLDPSRDRSRSSAFTSSRCRSSLSCG